jgi:hypothetical protein
MWRRVQLGHSAIVPQQAIPLAGEHERQADLGVDLGEPTRKRPQVERSVLEAARAEQPLVGGRLERLLGDVDGLLGEPARLQPAASRRLGQQQAAPRVEEAHRRGRVDLAGDVRQDQAGDVALSAVRGPGRARGQENIAGRRRTGLGLRYEADPERAIGDGEDLENAVRQHEAEVGFADPARGERSSRDAGSRRGHAAEEKGATTCGLVHGDPHRTWVMRAGNGKGREHRWLSISGRVQAAGIGVPFENLCGGATRLPSPRRRQWSGDRPVLPHLKRPPQELLSDN